MAALQVKNIPDDLHAKLRERAAREGRSLSGYVLTLLKEGVERPNWDDWFATLDTREPVHGITNEDVIKALDEARDERDEQLERVFLDRR